MGKILFSLFLTALCIVPAQPTGAQTTGTPHIERPEAPVTHITPLDVPRQDVDSFVAEWNKRSASIAKMPGFISATLYRSILPDHAYQLIEVAQWQSYTAWVAAHDHPALQTQRAGAETIAGFYRPAIAYTHYAAQSAQATSANALLDRVKKDPAIANPEAPFVFINLMEMAQGDIGPFLADWASRSQLTRQQAGSMSATLYKTLLPDSRYQIINISQWQSYNAFVDAQNDATYSRQLAKDLNQTSSIKLLRGFFRPVAYRIQTYD